MAIEFRDVVKKYAGDGEALGVKDSTVDGIPVPSADDFATAAQGAKADTAVQPDDLGAAASMSPVEVVTDPDAHAALSGAFARGHYWPRIPGQAIYLQNPDVAGFVNASLGAIGRALVDLVVVPFDATIVAYHFGVQAAGDATATIRPALYRQNSADASVPLELLHGGSPMAADSTGVRSVTGLSIPVTAGTVLRPAVKMETGTSVPSVYGHKTSAPAYSPLATVVNFGGSGLNYRADVGAGEWPASQVVNGSQSNGVRMLVEVVPA